MPDEENPKFNWLYRLADKVPIEVASSVVVFIVLLWVSPGILDRLKNNEIQVYCYLVIIGTIVIVAGIPMVLYAFSKYHERETKTFLTIKKANSTEEQEESLEIKRQIEGAVKSMEETVQ